MKTRKIIRFVSFALILSPAPFLAAGKDFTNAVPYWIYSPPPYRKAMDLNPKLSSARKASEKLNLLPWLEEK